MEKYEGNEHSLWHSYQIIHLLKWVLVSWLKECFISTKVNVTCLSPASGQLGPRKAETVNLPLNSTDNEESRCEPLQSPPGMDRTGWGRLFSATTLTPIFYLYLFFTGKYIQLSSSWLSHNSPDGGPPLPHPTTHLLIYQQMLFSIIF